MKIANVSSRGLALAAGTAMVLALGTFAAEAANTGSATINLNGTVPIVCTISTDAGGAKSVPFTIETTGTGAQTVSLGTVTEACNGSGGYYITVTSDNFATGGSPRLVGPNGEFLPYTVTQTPTGGTATPLDIQPINTAASATTSISVGRTSDSTTRALTLNYTPKQLAAGSTADGTYTDKLTLTITAK